MKQFKVALNPDLRDFLEAAAAKNGRSLAEEIRERLAGTLIDDGRDPTTRALTGEVYELARRVRRRFGVEWYADVNANAALVGAVADQVASHKPTVTSAAAPGTATLPADPPDVVGRVIAHEYRHEKQEIKASRTAYRNCPRSSKEQDND